MDDNNNNNNNSNNGGEAQQQQQQQTQQHHQRRRRLSMIAATSTLLQQQQQQQQPSSGGRRRAMSVRRSCSAVTDREMMVAGPWLPSRQHSAIKRTSRFYRELCSAWNSRVGSQNVNATAHRVQTLFNDLGLRPTAAQVAEMMQCAMKCANRSGSSPAYMTFGEFCSLAKKLKKLRNGLDRGIPRSVQFSRLLEKDQEIHVRGIRKNSTPKSVHSNYDVFLGGSCNPTTWRKELAIPYLQEVGVSFYNPQVDHWSQDLIEIEHAAKENATLLFYVIDSQTRNVVSDIEAANFAAHRKHLVLVIHPEDMVAGSTVAGEQISSEEAQDIREALSTLHKIASNQGILVFDNISQALCRVVQILKSKIHRTNNIVEDDNTAVYCKIRDAFNMFDTKGSGMINIFDIRMAIRLLASQNLTENEVLNLISDNKDSKAVSLGNDHQVCYTFDQFFKIVSKYLQLPEKNNHKNEFDIGCTYCPIASQSLCLSQECVETTRSSKTTDIYLAGESGDDIRWIDDIAIPMIKKSNLTYHAAAQIDLSVLLDAHTLLFVIPNNSRSLATMTLAAYCIAKKCRMVLCIQNLNNDNCIVRSETLTQTAINDYNRGRMYLADLALREQVPVFESITEAVETTIQKSL